MMKQLNLIINTCLECPYFDEEFNNADPKYNRCRMKPEPKYWMKKNFDDCDDVVIPDYCSLEDVVMLMNNITPLDISTSIITYFTCIGGHCSKKSICNRHYKDIQCTDPRITIDVDRCIKDKYRYYDEMIP